ncbi:STAS domain-containing protein [Paracoccus liaowanqingii]|nr:STAS domain-containing protein [Paracoccus liaowanqingii]
MNTSETLRDGLYVLHVGEPRLDASKAPELRVALLVPIEAGHKTMIVDLSEVRFMDSSALGAFIFAAKKMGSVGSIAIVGLNGVVARLFKLTSMDKVFAIHPTIDAAAATLGE